MVLKFRQSASRIELSVPSVPHAEYKSLISDLEDLHLDNIHIIQDPRLKTESSRHVELRSYSEEYGEDITAYEEYRITTIVENLNKTAKSAAVKHKRRAPPITMKVHPSSADPAI